MGCCFPIVYEIDLPALYPSKAIEPQSKGEVNFFAEENLFQIAPIEADPFELTPVVLIHRKPQMPASRQAAIPATRNPARQRQVRDYRRQTVPASDNTAEIRPWCRAADPTWEKRQGSGLLQGSGSCFAIASNLLVNSFKFSILMLSPAASSWPPKLSRSSEQRCKAAKRSKPGTDRAEPLSRTWARSLFWPR